MANPVCQVLLTENPLPPAGAALAGETGAVVDFWGVVRGIENGAPIRGLLYDAHHAMAEHQLRTVGEEAVGKFALNELLIHHRIGFVAAGEASLLVRATSQHRAAAFNAAQWVVEELKRRVPIWKHPQPRAAAGAVRRDDSALASAPLSPTAA